MLLEKCCSHCGEKTPTMWPSRLWYTTDILCEDCHEEEIKEIEEEEEAYEESNDFNEELEFSHRYSWCTL